MKTVAGLLMLGFVGCAQETATDDAAVYEAAIHVKDPAGRVRTGVALSTREFVGNPDSYLGSTQLILRDAGDRAIRPAYQERLEAARRALKGFAAIEAGSLGVAYVFEDDDVAGWSGPSLSDGAFRQTPDPSQPAADGAGIRRGLVAGFFWESITLVRGYDGGSASHLCTYAGYALGSRDPISTANSVQVSFQWMYPGTYTDDMVLSTINAANPSYNSGNWWWHGYGFYRVWFNHLSPINPFGQLVVSSNIGCMF
jgi:hypothetical protein